MSNLYFNPTTKIAKSPEQLVNSVCQALRDFNNPDLTEQKISNEQVILKRLGQMKIILYGDGKSVETDEETAKELAFHCIQSKLMYQLIEQLVIIPFEARKDTAHIFNNFIRKNLSSFADYTFDQFETVNLLITSYANPSIALYCGGMLRECIRYDNLADKILHSEFLWLFFDEYVHVRNFEVASDSFNTLRDLLTTPRNKSISSNFLQNQYEVVMKHYQKLLQSENFVTRWRSLKLLGDLLLDRSNFAIMIRFISSKENLKMIMNLLRDTSPNIQYEAFHVFKVFVAYPNKPPDVSSILYKNRDKLMAFLENFHTDKDDSQFYEEKCLLIE